MRLPSADTLIVGGGTAGCVIARRLVDRGQKVHIIEAGGPYRRLLLSPPLPSQRLRGWFSWNYHTVEQAGLGNRRISLPLGRVMGGSSAINAMMYCRGLPADYDRWLELGCEGWSYAEIEPYYRRAENFDARLRDPGDGLLRISAPRFRAPFSKAFLEACEQVGMRRRERWDGFCEEGCGLFEVTQSEGERTSTATAYLGAVRNHPSLTVTTGALVTRILIEHGRARGVEFAQGTSVRRAYAEGEVLLCAGVVNSPKILMLSGIGDAGALRTLGIEPVVDLPEVGRNLQDHIRVPVLYETPVRSPGDKRYWLPAALTYAVRRQGVFNSNCCEAGAYVRSNPDVSEPDLQFVTHFQHSLRRGVVDLQVCLLATRSRGQVTLASSDPAEAPLVDPNYLSGEAEMRPLIDGVELARSLAAAPALRRFPLGREVWPGSELTTGQELSGYFRRSMDTCYHLSGTCRMGSDALAVVDPKLRVRGIDRLRIADASVMPELIHGNTLAPVVMIGEKIADQLVGGVN